jgi:hypothetical protein
MKKTQSVTTLPVSPAEDRRKRMIQYTVAMSIRMVCVLLFFFVHGWWLLVVAIGAVVLPYVGVVLANNSLRSPGSRVEVPGGVVAIPEPFTNNGPVYTMPDPGVQDRPDDRPKDDQAS